MFFLEKLGMFPCIIIVTELIVQVEENQKGIWTP